jgi:hypothetical protein
MWRHNQAFSRMNTTRDFSSVFVSFLAIACGVFVCLIESMRGEQSFGVVFGGYIYAYMV